MEILLIKLSFMNGKGIDMAECIRRLIDRIDVEAVTAEAYADDLTIIFQMHARGLNLIIRILEGFEEVTGLALNKGKTQLMVVGGEGWGVGTEIEGISVVDSITLLGITIDRRLERLNANWLAKIGVMRRLCAYWNSFGLSISGRVSVAKTYILAQATYLMGVLPMSPNIGDIINDVLITFVAGRDRPIERRRQMLQTELGGYGLIDVKIMNTCTKAMWIQRWIGGFQFPDFVPAAVTGLEMEDTELRMEENVRGNRIIWDIIRNWRIFKEGYYKIRGQVLEARLFVDEVLGTGGGKIGNVVFSAQRRRVVEPYISRTKVKEVLEGNQCKEKIEIERETGILLTWAEYFRL
jgi:hypothetical protein